MGVSMVGTSVCQAPTLHRLSLSLHRAEIQGWVGHSGDDRDQPGMPKTIDELVLTTMPGRGNTTGA